MEYLIEGELVDTYGGDYTYRDVLYEELDEKEYVFYERYYGAKSSELRRIEDEEEIAEFISDLRVREIIKNDKTCDDLLNDLNSLGYDK